MSDKNLTQLFEKTRNNGYMDTETQQAIFKELANVWSCFTLNGNEFVRVHNIENPDVAKVSRYGGWNKGCTERITLTDFNTDMIGIACGPYNGILVLDIDDEKKFASYCKKNHLQVPESFKIKTGDGYHLYYKYPEDGNYYGTDSFKKYGFDIRGRGGYVAAPGSIHPNGSYYDISNPNNGVFANPPQWMLDLCIRPDTADNRQEGSDSPVQQIALEQDPSQALEALEASLPSEVRAKLKTSFPKEERSEPIFSVLVALVNANISDSNIKLLFYSNRLGDRFREKGDKYFDDEIKRARDFVKNSPACSPTEKKKTIDVLAEAETLVCGLEYFENDEGKVFCKASLNGQIRYLDIDSPNFSGFICEEVKRHCNKRITLAQFKDILNGLKFHFIFDIKLQKIKSIKRFFQDSHTLIYNPGGRYPEPISIKKNGIGLAQQSIPLDVKQDSDEVAIDLTEYGLENFNQLLDLFQIKDRSQRHYLLVHCLSYLFEAINTPILYLHGNAGSGKTTLGTTIRNIFDPQAGRGAPFPTKTHDFITYTSNYDVVFFDNFTSLSDTIQNNLCHSYSGGHNIQRKLYSDNNSLNIVFKCSIILASIDIPRLRQDLISRIVFIKVDKKDNLLSEIDLNSRVNILLPKVRGEIINLASKVLNVINAVTFCSQSRHSDFEKLANATIDVLSKDADYQEYFEKYVPVMLDIATLLNSKETLAYGEVLNQFIRIIRSEQIKFFTMNELYIQISNLVRGYTGNAAALGRLMLNNTDILERNDIFLIRGNKVDCGRVYFAYDKNAKSYPFLLDIDNLQKNPAAIVKKYQELAVSPPYVES